MKFPIVETQNQGYEILSIRFQEIVLELKIVNSRGFTDRLKNKQILTTL